VGSTNFNLLALGNNAFLIAQVSASLVFNTSQAQATELMLGKYKFKKVK